MSIGPGEVLVVLLVLLLLAAPVATIGLVIYFLTRKKPAVRACARCGMPRTGAPACAMCGAA